MQAWDPTNQLVPVGRSQGHDTPDEASTGAVVPVSPAMVEGPSEGIGALWSADLEELASAAYEPILDSPTMDPGTELDDMLDDIMAANEDAEDEPATENQVGLPFNSVSAEVELEDDEDQDEPWLVPEEETHGRRAGQIRSLSGQVEEYTVEMLSQAIAPALVQEEDEDELLLELDTSAIAPIT